MLTVKEVWLFVFLPTKKEERRRTMKKTNNAYATNKGGIIRAPKNPAPDSPKSTVVKGDDLRVKKSSK